MKLFAVLLFIVISVQAQAETIRVGLVRQFNEAPEVTVCSTAGLIIFGSKCDKVLKVTIARHNGSIEVKASDGTPLTAGEKIEVSSASSDGIITISLTDGPSSEYRGKITAAVGKKGLLLVNVIDVEEYLLGVMPSEMPSGFHTEALKAQAVAARTYACATRDRHEKEGYDLCDATHCQLYLGAGGEKERTSKAVSDTAGLVAVYDGKLISAQYCSDCGGITQNGNQPYLVSVSDKPDDGGNDHCESTGHTWTKTWPADEFEKLLLKSFPELIGLKSVSVVSTNGSGRADGVRIEGENGEMIVPAARLRGLLGYNVIKSTVFSVRMEDGSVIFEGKGFGHGFGLCQFGANGLASPPYNYTFDRILKHYYRGIEIVPMSSLGGTHPQSPAARPSAATVSCNGSPGRRNLP